MLVVRVSDPILVHDLVRTLEDRAHYVVKQIHDDTVAVSVLGSFADGGEQDLRKFLAEWRSRRPDVDVELAPDDAAGAPGEQAGPGERPPPRGVRPSRW